MEWSKCWAWKRRWDEELELLEEEMRRTLLSLRFESTRWKARVVPKDDAFSEGMVAYATWQAAIRDALASKFEALWALPDEKPRHRKLNIDVLDEISLRDGDDCESDDNT